MPISTDPGSNRTAPKATMLSAPTRALSITVSTTATAHASAMMRKTTATIMDADTPSRRG